MKEKRKEVRRVAEKDGIRDGQDEEVIKDKASGEARHLRHLGDS